MFRGWLNRAQWRIPLLFCLAAIGAPSQTKGGQEMGIKIESSAFKEGGMIPLKYTCDGEDVSPPLKWGDLPTGTKSIALISDDPDAPGGTWVHWVLYNLPSDVGRCLKTSRRRRPSKTVPSTAPMTSRDPATAVHALLEAPIDTSSSFTPWTRRSIWRPGPARPSCSRRWKVTPSTPVS